jgi:glycosyltransferase involved in cell wall biosynthesis
MKVVIFGTGKRYQDYIEQVNNNCDVVACIDNNPIKWNTFLNGVEILPPSLINNIEYDYILILSMKEKEMREQLSELGIPQERVWNIKLFSLYVQRGNIRIFGTYHRDTIKVKKKILIVAHYLSYDGSSMAALYALYALKNRGFDAVLASYDGNEKFIKEVSGEGNTIIICPSLRYIHDEEFLWIRQFDLVIVNTFPMIMCACQISQEMPVLWWIHECADESRNEYLATLRNYWYMKFEDKFDNVSIYAVSNIAKNNFNMYFPKTKLKVLPYGIPDSFNGVYREQYIGKKLIFAIIGNICARKAQDIFVDAVGLLNNQYNDMAEFWIIGSNEGDDYYKKVCNGILDKNNIKMLGEMTRKEINRAYQDIDIVVCSSLEETMSIVVTEAMMYGKPCITTDMTGIADYIHNQFNGIICKTGNVGDLCEKMKWMICNRDKLYNMGINARKTYEKYFAMGKFADRLNHAIDETIESYNKE